MSSRWLAHRGVSDSLSSEMHCGCCEQSQYVNRLLVCSTLYSFVFLLHLTLLQGHKLLWYWKYLNIKISRTFFFFSSVIFIAIWHSGNDGIVGKTGYLNDRYSCVCLSRVLDRFWLSDSPASPALAAILKVLERSLGLMFGSFHSAIFWSNMCVFVYRQQLDCFITAT